MITRRHPLRTLAVYVCLVGGIQFISVLAYAQTPNQSYAVDENGLQRESAGDEIEQGGPTPAGPVLSPADEQEERTGLLWIFPDAYGTFELRHTTLRTMDADRGLVHVTRGPVLLDNSHETSDSPHLEIRPTIGSTFFNGQVDTSFTYVFVNDVGSSVVRKFDVFNTTQWNVLEGEFKPGSYYSLGPTAFTDMMTADGGGASFSYSDIGIFGEASYQFAVPTGTLSVRGYCNPAIELYSGEQSKKNRAYLVRGNEQASDRGGALLNEDDEADASAPQQHPLYLAYYGVNAFYLPHAAPNLALGLGFDIIQTWKPIYKEVAGGDSATYQMTGHGRDAVSSLRFTTSYQVNKRVAIVNQLRHYTAGIWQRSITDSSPEHTGQILNVSWENRLSLIINLF